MKWNVVGAVVETIEADSAEEAQAEMNRALRQAGFEPYDLIPVSAMMRPFPSEDQSSE
jgi:hypothetical protein